MNKTAVSWCFEPSQPQRIKQQQKNLRSNRIFNKSSHKQSHSFLKNVVRHFVFKSVTMYHLRWESRLLPLPVQRPLGLWRRNSWCRTKHQRICKHPDSDRICPLSLSLSLSLSPHYISHVCVAVLAKTDCNGGFRNVNLSRPISRSQLIFRATTTIKRPNSDRHFFFHNL